ncbi:serine hydrolase [Roseomonas sp. M0104]|uniref:Serine hydrolase n=1 Tax=Teichococcus coralli TaxID=2545983 RepID=A0A845BBJ7_9PROT|nr:serine hydrolase [Pseudoroseomonas coralli]MXP63496.1 serine hydrolase [Pseudoroseomonas coralli]
MDLDLTLIDRRVERLLAPYAGKAAPGMTIGVVRGGELVVHRSAGLASIEHGVPIGPATTFRIASVSKQFTCAAILMLAREGKIDIEANARTYLPELPDTGAVVTVAHLMHNVSGIRDMLEIMRQGGADLGVPVRPEDLLEGVCRQRGLNFAPGTRYLYSNSNFMLLGRIAERVSGQPLAAFLEQRIFAPLGMNATRMTESVHLAVPNLATGYFPAAEGFMRAPHAFPLHGEGGLVSSVQDLALWDRNLTTGRVGGDWLATELTRPAPFPDGAPNIYARGLILRPYRGVETVSHGGLWPGYKTEFLRVPSRGVTVIAIANHGGLNPNLLAHRALDAVLEGLPGIHPLPALPPKRELEKLAGRYFDEESASTVDIGLTPEGVPTFATNGMVVEAEGLADGRLTSPRSSSLFTVRPLGPDRIEVEQDAGHRRIWRRVAGGAALPEGLAATYFSEEMAARWTIAPEGDRLRCRVAGPVTHGGPWDVEGIEGDILRIHVPGTLYQAWLDARVLRAADGAITGLLVNGGRARQVRYRRV